jgi:hypothetical protein
MEHSHLGRLVRLLLRFSETLMKCPFCSTVCFVIYSILVFWLWGWVWRLSELRPLLRAYFSSPDENEWVNGWMNEWMKWISERTIFLIFGNVELTVEWYWQGKTEELGDKPVPVPLCSPRIPLDWIRAAAMREFTPLVCVYCIALSLNNLWMFNHFQFKETLKVRRYERWYPSTPSYPQNFAFISNLLSIRIRAKLAFKMLLIRYSASSTNCVLL